MPTTGAESADPITVFKYGSRYIYDILKKKRIYVSAAHELNDPFELSPNIDPECYSEETLRAGLHKETAIEYCYEMEAKSKGIPMSVFRVNYFASIDARLEIVKKNAAQNAKDAKAKFAQLFNEHWRLFCVSRRNNSILMWSHYADNHRGAVIEFDLSHSPFNELEEFMRPVTYQNEKANFLYSPVKGKFHSSILEVACTKSKDWEYEEETRMLFPVTAFDSRNFVYFEPHAIRHVYFGAKIRSDTRANLEILLHSPELRHVGITQTSVSADFYRLDFTLIRPACRVS